MNRTSYNRTSYTHEITSSVSAKRKFKALHIESHNLMPNILPHAINRIECHGDVGVGNVRTTHFQEGSSIKYMKHRMDEFDEDNLSCKFTMFEGDDVLSDKFHKIVTEVKFKDYGKGCCCYMTTHVYTWGGIVFMEEEIHTEKQKTTETFRVMEEYLQANPHVCA